MKGDQLLVKISIIRVYTLLIWFMWGYLGGFKWGGQLITKYFFEEPKFETNK